MTRRHVPQPSQAPNNPITEKDDPYQMSCPQLGGRWRGERGRRQPAKPSLIRLLISHVPIEAVNKTDALSPASRPRSIRLPFFVLTQERACLRLAKLPPHAHTPSPAFLWGRVEGVLTVDPSPGDPGANTREHMLRLARAGAHVGVGRARSGPQAPGVLPALSLATADGPWDPDHARVFPGSTR